MKEAMAIRFYETGAPEVLKIEKIQIPSPGAGEVLIRQKAIGLNFIDTYYRSGLYQIALPSGLGFEGSGIVEEVGPGVRSFKVGDRVAYPHGALGAYGEYLNAKEVNLVHLPKNITFEEGAAMMLKGLTVQYLFRQVTTLHKDQMILFHAAAGGVGLIACQWARHLGVKLIGTVSSEEKAREAMKNGAYATINYSTEDVVQKVLDLTHGKKVSVVYDSVGKSTWDRSLDSLSPRGLMVSFGNASGPVTGVNLSTLAQKGSLYVTRPVLGTFIDTHEKLQKASDELFDLVAKKIINIQIGKKYKLTEVIAAHHDLENRKTMGSSILIP